MFGVREAVGRIEAKLERQKLALSQIETKLQQDPKPEKKSGWDIFTIFVPMIQALALAIVAYFLTDSVNRTLRERELDLSNAKEMGALLLKLNTPDIDDHEAEATAMTLTAFGRYAVGPLVSQLQGGTAQSSAAEKALIVLATSEPDPVCQAVWKILRNRMRLYTARSYIAAARLAGASECHASLADLKALRARLGTGTPEEALPKLREIVLETPDPSRAEVMHLRGELDNAILALQN